MRGGPADALASRRGRLPGSDSELYPHRVCDRVDVLVPATGKGDDDDPIPTELPRPLGACEQRVGRLERRKNPFETGEVVEGFQGLRVRDGDIVSPSRILQVGELGTHSRVVEPRGDAVGLEDLAVLVL